MVIDKRSEKIICVSVYNGKAHDLTIFKDTLKITPSIQVLADSGYRGIQKVHANTLYPKKHKDDVKRLSDEQIKALRETNSDISSKRMKVEHVIGRIKRFGIISERYRNRRKRFGLRLNLICGIVNYENSLRMSVTRQV